MQVNMPQSISELHKILTPAALKQALLDKYRSRPPLELAAYGPVIVVEGNAFLLGRFAWYDDDDDDDAIIYVDRDGQPEGDYRLIGHQHLRTADPEDVPECMCGEKQEQTGVPKALAEAIARTSK
jgi:hypothetical protein